jgi:asparagine synthase (glutamine-hydrolysing)
MNTMLQHRGPDDSGIFSDEHVTLGNQRLSILDIAGGHQPMRRENLVITYNGEVYNHGEIREELRAKGRTFNTKSDTEVVLEAYAEWGPASVFRFNGMWALCVYDSDEGALFISRDRYGIKPVYYRQDEEGRLVFSSEIKPILRTGVPKRVNERMMRDYLFYGYTDFSSETFFEGVNRLMPSRNLHYEIESRTLEESKAG